MTLVEIIARLITADGRATHQLPRGLWLVYYPPAGDDDPHRLIAGRYLTVPSAIELRIVRDALLDAHPSRVPADIATEWDEVTNNDWNGRALTWYMLPTTDALSGDPDRARRVRLALDEHQQRELQRQRRQNQRRRPAANPGPKPLL
ncbi:protein of unknown function [Candidatus Promineifilum breve]|uniref:Uncharacterized protein n=1 Tax=Candidatus Promineifilum breve TaxID=1806508 RepID=A0A160T3H4_9CHLR|nr:hypothetical protein [Candidatus Promineifilum breve]CUS04262.2 protein of unknown function [Candidatus Promineifilum breve]